MTKETQTTKALGERAYRIYRLHYSGIDWNDMSRPEKFAWDGIAKSIREMPARERKVECE